MKIRIRAPWLPAGVLAAVGLVLAVATAAPPAGTGKTPKKGGKAADPNAAPVDPKDAPVDPKVPPPPEVEPEPLEMEEYFRVSRVGKPNVKESREVLMSLYEEIAKRHASEMEVKRGEELETAETFRILELVTGPEEEGENLCLCEHGVGFCVVSFPAGAFPKGETTPPMSAEKGGAIAYRVKARRPYVEGAPNAAEFSGSGAAFFGALGVGVKPGLEISLTPKSADSPPAAAAAGPEVMEEFGKKYEIFTADLTLPKWTAHFPTTSEVVTGGKLELTRDQFVQGLRDGKTYEVKVEEVRKCPTCFGFGRVADASAEVREKDGKRDCPTCLGKKELLHKITYMVEWGD